MCTKQPKTCDELIKLLESKGLVFSNKELSKKFILDVNYYRFSGYLLSYKNTDGSFKKNTSFEQIISLYEFDSKLRSILFKSLEFIEISFRSKLAYFHANKYGALGYINPTYFQKKDYHSTFLDKLDLEIKKNQIYLLFATIILNIVENFHYGLQ